jgi:hypothetical protein
LLPESLSSSLALDERDLRLAFLIAQQLDAIDQSSDLDFAVVCRDSTCMVPKKVLAIFQADASRP